jgi:large subunit ribosomal protein L25
MAQTYELAATPRERTGTGAARALRREGYIPAVIYGTDQPAMAVAVSAREVLRRLHGGGFYTTVATLDIAGDKVQVIPRDYQLEPVRDTLLHVDFLRIGKDTVLSVDVPVHFVGEEESPGLKRGGVLNVVRHTVELDCPANEIPSYIECDLAGLDIGDGIHISAVTLPENVKPTIRDRDFTIATIAAPAGLKSEEEEAADAAAAEEGAAEAEEGEAEE